MSPEVSPPLPFSPSPFLEAREAAPRVFFQPVEAAALSDALARGETAPLAAGEGVNLGSRGLGSRVTQSASWSIFGAIVSQLSGVVRTVILARLLTQFDFGLAAMTLTVASAVFNFTNAGIVASIISSRFDDEDELHRYVNLVWTIEATKGFLIAALIALSAWPASHFYHQPRLFPVLLVMALQPLLGAPFNVGILLQQRQLDMKRLTMHGFLTNGVTVSLTIVLALLTRNYWAIIWGQVLGALAGSVFSYVLSPFRPRWEWHPPLAKRAYDFGKHQFVIGLCDYVLTTMDNVLVGFLLGAVSLGIYSVAYSFCTMARQVAVTAFSSVLFPAFAAAGREDDPKRLSSIVERSFTLGMVGLTLFLVPLIVYAPAVMRIFFPKWGVSAVEPMRWLLVAGWFVSLLALFSSFFVGLDRPGFESKFKVLDAAVFVAILIPLTRAHGVVGAAQAGAISWALAATWRWNAARTLVPGAFGRLPFLIAACGVVGTLATLAGLWPFAGNSVWSLAGFARAFHPRVPSLGMAWLQLMVAAPLVAMGCTLGLMAISPIARREIPQLSRKLFGRLIPSR